jgi:hypothetical protein
MYALARASSSAVTGASRIARNSLKSSTSELSVTSVRTLELALNGPGSGRYAKPELTP